MIVAISLDKNTLTINDKTYKAEVIGPVPDKVCSCKGCAFHVGACMLEYDGIDKLLQNSCWCTSMERPDKQSIIWKEEVKP